MFYKKILRDKAEGNPQPILEFLEKMPVYSLKSLSQKLVILLDFATGQRLQTISLMKISHIEVVDGGYQIYIPDHIKTSGVNIRQPCLKLPLFSEKPKLCVTTTLKIYLEMTRDIRHQSCQSLFLTFKKPHGAATKQTLSRWII